MSQHSQTLPRTFTIRHDFSETVGRLAGFFRRRAVAAYLVGGAVRDAILGHDASDHDVAVDGDAANLSQELADTLGGRMVPLDAARGIYRVVLGDDHEVSSIDLNSAPDGIAADLARRDFTIDAMAIPLDSEMASGGEAVVLDPHDGETDLRSGTVRMLGPRALSDDPARLVRAPRLAAQLRFTVEPDTTNEIRRCAHLVNSVAPERVRDELLKLLAEPDATKSLRLLDELGLLCRIIPELEEARGVTQPKEHYWDVFEHLLETPGQVERVLDPPEGEVEQSIPRFDGFDDYFAQRVGDGQTRKTVLKLTALLHDISKPAVKSFEPSGRMRFFGHHIEGAERCDEILHRLRVSRRSIEMVRTMVHHHLRPGQLSQKGEKPTARAVYRYHRDLGGVAVDTLYLNMADYLAARGPMLELDDWREHCETLAQVLTPEAERGVQASRKGLVGGHDVMAALSLSAGPLVGELLEAVREAEAAGEISTRDEALRLAAEKLTEARAGA